MIRLLLSLVTAGAWVAPSLADSTQARCDIYQAGSDTAEKTIPCSFSQRQGYITITRNDGKSHDLEPTGEAVGNFRDQNGRAVYRNSGLGDQGLIFRFPDESIYVYWSTAGLELANPDNPTSPFTTEEYDATTLLRCRGTAEAEFGSCPAGILRMENSQASIVVQSPSGEQFTINFLTDYVNATNREAKAVLNGDLWTVTINGEEIYEVPLAAIEGG